MPRIRTLKPEHKAHRKVGPLGHFDYRLWVGMLPAPANVGRPVAGPAQLRIIVFAYHPDVTVENVEAGLVRLADTALIHRYEVKNVRYAVFPSWHDHQVIDRWTPSTLPKPPGLRSVGLHERSTKARRGLGEDSARTRRALA